MYVRDLKRKGKHIKCDGFLVVIFFKNVSYLIDVIPCRD